MFKVSGLEKEYKDWISSLIEEMGKRYIGVTDEHVKILKDKYIEIFIQKIKEVYLFFLTEDQISKIINFWSSPSGIAYSSSKIKIKLAEEISNLSILILEDCNSLNGGRNG